MNPHAPSERPPLPPSPPPAGRDPRPVHPRDWPQDRPRAWRAIFFLLVVLLVGRHGVLVARSLALSGPVDLGAYYLHTRMLWEGADPTDAGQLLAYGQRLGLRPLRGVNPPTYYFLFLPFALLPWAAARAIWVLLSEAALWGIGWIAWRELKKRGVGPVEGALGVAGFLAVFYPAQQSIALGQVDVFLGLAAAAMGLALARGRNTAAGILALLAAGTKIQLGAVLVFLILAGRIRREIWAVLVVGAVWLAGVLAIFGPQAVSSYLHFIAALSGKALDPDSVNYSLNGLLARTLLPRAGPAIANLTYTLLSAALALFSLWVVFLRRRPGELGHWLWVGFLFLAVWMISPFSEEHHLTWVLAPLLIACVQWAPRVGRVQAALFVSAVALIGVQYYPHTLWTQPDLLSELLRSSKFLGPAVLWSLSASALIGLRAAPGGPEGGP